ncbi:MAG: DUF2796 domain-containing protein [Rudaea sp.]|nr:DUF2796 domain-containing protein [Rudaea sp.]
MNSRRFLYLLILAGPLSSGSADAQTQRVHDSHVHGTMIVNVVQSGHDLNIGFELPGANAVGFEHAPHSEAEQAKVDAALTTLQSPEEWLRPNAEALCRRTFVGLTPNVYHTAEESESQQNPDHSHHQHRADIGVQYTYNCDAPFNLKALEFDLIERFPGTHSIVVNLTLPSGLTKQVLSSPRAQILFVPSVSEH